MKPATRSYYEVAVRRAVERIVDSLDGALDLHELAKCAHLSPFHFHRIFKGAIGETPLELHRRLRLERAAVALRDTDAPVTSIAFAAGYETHESFTRAFSTRYVCAPSEFRRMRSAQTGEWSTPLKVELAAPSGIHFTTPSSTITIRYDPGEVTMKVTVKEMKEMRVATVRHVGPYSGIGEAFGKLSMLAGQHGLFEPGASMIGIYYDDPETTPPAELRADAGITIDSNRPVPDGLEQIQLPAGRYACTTHQGPYIKIGDTWIRLMGQWLPKSEHRVAEGVCYELYLNSPGQVPENELLTELYVPIA